MSHHDEAVGDEGFVKLFKASNVLFKKQTDQLENLKIEHKRLKEDTELQLAEKDDHISDLERRKFNLIDAYTTLSERFESLTARSADTEAALREQLKLARSKNDDGSQSREGKLEDKLWEMEERCAEYEVKLKEKQEFIELLADEINQTEKADNNYDTEMDCN